MGVATERRIRGKREREREMALPDGYYVTGCLLLPLPPARANLTRHQSEADGVRPQNNDTRSLCLGLGTWDGVGIMSHDRGELLPSPKKPTLSRRDYRCEKEGDKKGRKKWHRDVIR